MDFGKVFDDIGVKLTVAAAVAGVTAAAIVNPNQKQKDASAQLLFQQNFDRLTPTDKRAAEFHAGHKRWNGFFQNSIYPLTRSLPGANNPILNPYKDAEPMGGGQDEDD